jgi:NADP-dependent 3-hydroxy acid dehydrogenase YdfG
MSTDIDLTARRVLVTGASSGIGAELCRSIVRHGGSVAMLARRRERLAALQEELGGRATALPCDVTDLEALEATINAGAKALGGLNAVIAVAGANMVGTIASGAPQQWRALVDLNLIAPLATVRHVLGHFPANGRRDVVLIGSTGAVTPIQGVGIYGASKRGLRAAFDTLRLELAASGVNVSLVMPGMFETEGLFDRVTLNGEVPSSQMEMFVPGGGPVSPQPLAETIAFMMALPETVCVNELVMRPTAQLNP